MIKDIHKHIDIVLKAMLIIFILFISTINLFSQKEIILDNSFNNLKWSVFVEKVESKFDICLYFDENELIKPDITVIIDEIPLITYLQNIFTNQKINITQFGKNIFLYKGEKIKTVLDKSSYQIVKNTKPESNPVKEKLHTDQYLKTSKEHLGRIKNIGNKNEGLKHRKAILKGRILDSKEQSPLFGATVLVQELGIGKATDSKGRFSFKLKKGKYTLVFNEINHKEKKIEINILSSGHKDFFIEPQSVSLKDVIITADAYNKIKSTKMGFERLLTQNIKEIPLVMGERDILKIATLLPGIQNVGEGTSGFNVRGSPVDQNLFYIDGIPIYNTSHFFGFFSVFNSETISEFSLSKANIPAKFGGRLASIFDITAKEGNNKKFKIRGGISPITGRVMIEGPIKKEKSSYMLGVRSTYSNWILRLIDKPDFKKSSVYFADAILKLSFHLNQKNNIEALSYFSYDDINFAKRSLYDIKNQGASLKWKHFFKDNFNMNLSLIASKYFLNTENREYIYEAYKQNNNLAHNEIKLNFLYHPGRHHRINFGASSILYQINNGKFLPASDQSKITAKELGKEKGMESGFFLSHKWEPNAKLTFLTGLRYNIFSYLGPKSIYLYQQDTEKKPSSVIDTLHFGSNQFIKTYTGLDYRISAKYAFNQNISIKSSYNRLHQYIFLLSNTIALSPTDNWKMADYNINPMQGDQISLGIYSNLFNNKYELSIEGYYKKIKNLVEFKDGADFLANAVPEWNILQGQMDVKGIEVMLKKSRGRINGWINYTYLNSSVLVNSPVNGEQINFGKPYPSNYDKPHSVNIVFNYKILRRLSLSSNFVYSTGKPITYPTTIYYQNGIKLINFTERNAYRIPDYFRMDISIKAEGNLKAKKRLHGIWIFSVYNLLGRYNIYNVFFKVNNIYNDFYKKTNIKIQGYKVAIFPNPVFSITYNYKFGNYEY